MDILNTKKRILLIGDEGVALFRVSSGRAARIFNLSWKDENFAVVLRQKLVKQDRNVPLQLLFDMLDQQYRKETIPKISFFDRNKVVNRRLNIAFPKVRVKAALPLREKPQDEGKVYLFAALPSNRRMEMVYEAVITSGVPLSGLSLLPIESAQLASKIADNAFKHSESTNRWTVLIGKHQTGGLRQIVTKNGELALTRLTPVQKVGEEEPNVAEDIQREFQSTLSYIKRFGYAHGDDLDLVIVTSDRVEAALQSVQWTTPNVLFCKPGKAAQLAGLKYFEETGPVFTDILHAAWAGSRSKAVLPMQTPVLDRINKPRQIARGVTALLILAALIVGVYGAYKFIVLQDTRAEHEIAVQKKRQLEAEYKREMAIFDSLPMKPETVKAALDVHDRVKALATDPVPYVKMIVESMTPRMRLQGIRMKPDKQDILYEPIEATQKRRSRRGGEEKAQDARPTVSIDVEFMFPESQDPAVGAREVEQFVDTMRAKLPQHVINIKKQIGSLSISERLNESLDVDPVTGLPVTPPSVKYRYATVEMTGEAL